MNKRNFYVGMGMGLMVGGAAAMLMRPKKSARSMFARARHTMGEVADSITDNMGW